MSAAALVATGEGHFALAGELSFRTVGDLLNQSNELFRPVSRLHIDLQDVTRADSAGLSLLVEWMREAARRHQVIAYANLPQQMLDIAGTCGLTKVLPITT